MEWEPWVVLQENNRQYPLLQSMLKRETRDPGLPWGLEIQIPPSHTDLFHWPGFHVNLLGKWVCLTQLELEGKFPDPAQFEFWSKHFDRSAVL